MIARSVEAYLKSVYAHFPVVFLTGPRQSGKTTLARALFPHLPYVLLELPDQRQLAEGDPRSFLSRFPQGAVLDEVQNVPQLFSYLQGIVDENREVRFVLTGSQNFLLNERITQSLAGRAGIVTLLPLSMHEVSQETISGKKVYEDLLLRGFYPELYNRDVPSGLFFPSYVQTYLERDVRSLQNIGNLSQFNLFLKLCAGRVGQLLNTSSLASDAGVSVNTAKAWLSILEASYIVFRLPPHHVNFKKRLVKSPKLYFIDTGLACHLLGIETTEQLSTHFSLGPLFENFIILELYKQRLAKGTYGGMYFWRDNKGLEIDLLLEALPEIHTYEIKAGRTFNASYFDNLVKWGKLSGNIRSGIVIYGGDVSQQTQSGFLKSWRELIREL